MYNSLIALGIAILTFLLGYLVAGWIAGVLPALLALGLAWFLLARRTGQQLQPIMAQAQVLAQEQKLVEARQLIETAAPLGKWQFLVDEQLHTQLGALWYLEAVMAIMQQQKTASKAPLEKAREHFEKAAPGGWRSYLLGWQPSAMLATVKYRQGDADGALKLLEAASSGARTEPVFWALYAWMLNEQKKRDEALVVLGRGLKAHEKNGPLGEMRDALANKKRPNMIVFGEAWYQFFPEAMRDDPKVIELAQAQQARQQRRQSPKTWPAPRR